MKKANDDLKFLIDSLTKGEKRLFKLQSNLLNGDKLYLNLFEALEKQKTFNDAELKQLFPKNLSVAKNYLFESIINSIQLGGLYKDLDSQHSWEIEKYKILLFKGLNHAAQIQLKKIKKTTLEDEAFIKHLYILNQEYVEVFKADTNLESSGLLRVINERNNTLNIIANYVFVSDVYFKIRLFLKNKYFCQTKKEKEELHALIKPILNFNEKDLLSITSKSLYNMAMSEYYSAIFKYDSALAFSKNYLQIKRGSKGNKVELQTLLEMGNYLLLSLKCNNLGDFEKDLFTLENLMTTISQNYRYAFCYERWYLIKLKWFHLNKKSNEALQFIKAQNKTYHQNRPLFSMKYSASIYYFTAKHYFNTNSLKESLRFLNMIINEIDSRVEEFLYAKILKLFIYIQSKEFFYIETETRSILNYIKKSGKGYELELYVIKYLNTNHPIDRKTKQDFKKQIQELEKSNYRSTYYIDFTGILDNIYK
jgi:hypothetical protein